MTTLSQAPTRRRFGRPPWPALIGVLVLLALIGLFLARRSMLQTEDPLQGATTALVTRTTLVDGISATGKIEPRMSADLAFPVNTGLIQDVLVEEGDSVARGTALIRLDERQIAAEAAAAEAALAQAQADLTRLQEGATPEEIAAAQAGVVAAQGSLLETQGQVTSTDIQAAQGAVEAAQERLTLLMAGPDNEDVTRARATLDQARANLERQRTMLSADKEAARLAIETQANQVREAQIAYSTAYWDLHYIAGSGQDPRELEDLTDAETRDFVNALDQAELELHNAEAALAQAQVAYDTAHQDEINGLAAAEADVAAAQSDLDQVLQGTDVDELAAARADLARAQADLARLQGLQREGALVREQGNLANAQARLEQLQADPRASDLARAEAAVARARAQLERASTDLDITTLRAPFAGVVSQVNVAPGETIGQTPVLTLLDISRYKVVVQVDEVDVARVNVGQPVTVLIDALGEPPLDGTVRNIAPQSLQGQSVTSYEVTVQIAPGDRPIKPGMTASATIMAAEQAAALSVPVQAVRTENGQTVVSIVAYADDGTPLVTTQVVETGLQMGDQIEIRSGLEQGQEVVIDGTQ